MGFNVASGFVDKARQPNDENQKLNTIHPSCEADFFCSPEMRGYRQEGVSACAEASRWRSDVRQRRRRHAARNPPTYLSNDAKDPPRGAGRITGTYILIRRGPWRTARRSK